MFIYVDFSTKDKIFEFSRKFLPKWPIFYENLAKNGVYEVKIRDFHVYVYLYMENFLSEFVYVYCIWILGVKCIFVYKFKLLASYIFGYRMTNTTLAY